jgi:hypothetical protein
VDNLSHFPVEAADFTAYSIPSFDLWKLSYTAIGVMIAWGKLGRSKLRPYVLADVIEMIPIGENGKYLIEFLVFLILGCAVGIGVTDPRNVAQAIMAGFGWTGIFSQYGRGR